MDYRPCPIERVGGGLTGCLGSAFLLRAPVRLGRSASCGNCNDCVNESDADCSGKTLVPDRAVGIQKAEFPKVLATVGNDRSRNLFFVRRSNGKFPPRTPGHRAGWGIFFPPHNQPHPRAPTPDLSPDMNTLFRPASSISLRNPRPPKRGFAAALLLLAVFLFGLSNTTSAQVSQPAPIYGNGTSSNPYVVLEGSDHVAVLYAPDNTVPELWHASQSGFGNGFVIGGTLLTSGQFFPIPHTSLTINGTTFFGGPNDLSFYPANYSGPYFWTASGRYFKVITAQTVPTAPRPLAASNGWRLGISAPATRKPSAGLVKISVDCLR